jgi:hypothetical protein
MLLVYFDASATPCCCFRASAVDIIDILSDAFDAYAALYKICEFTRAPLLPRDFLFAGWLAHALSLMIISRRQLPLSALR